MAVPSHGERRSRDVNYLFGKLNVIFISEILYVQFVYKAPTHKGWTPTKHIGFLYNVDVGILLTLPIMAGCDIWEILDNSVWVGITLQT